MTSLLLAFVLGPMTIRWLTRMKVGQVVRTDGPETHLEKAGTPTMGGVLIIMSAGVSTLLWADLTNGFTILALVALIWMGLLGFLDDYLKVVQKKSRGLVATVQDGGPGRFSGWGSGSFLIYQPILAGAPELDHGPLLRRLGGRVLGPGLRALRAHRGGRDLQHREPHRRAGRPGSGAWRPSPSSPSGSSPTSSAGSDASAYLGLFYLPGAGELSIYAAALAGAAIGFLWYNAHPATVFMGDTGSLALGGAIGVMAILLKTEFLLVIVGGVFVMEGVSVILQTG